MSDTNTGYYNSGHYNSGDYNSGDYNSGHYNSGDYNSGHYNSGHYNSGDYNSGHYNSGDYNSGDRNSGDYNSGDYNSGHYNSGDYNSGDYNSGDRNSGDRNSGMFNTDEPNARLFNKESNVKMSELINSDAYPDFSDFKLNYWISEEKMTDKEKGENPTYKTTEGFLKTVDYKTAWAVFWRTTTEENRKKFLDLPNFDWKIFTEITGIEQEDTVEELTMEQVIKELGREIKIKK